MHSLAHIVVVSMRYGLAFKLGILSFGFTFAMLWQQAVWRDGGGELVDKLFYDDNSSDIYMDIFGYMVYIPHESVSSQENVEVIVQQ